eukprot:TRINITY_DN29767_c0_g2_i1.p1 TRINITY_DN29767_c0_g2~~TRINITY_DN29767_c0_g2_i1.p1  ORF type:complete len:445 (+),score=48.01 TRINITY_DN29767_c0_g2_i1:57-1391(+)
MQEAHQGIFVEYHNPDRSYEHTDLRDVGLHTHDAKKQITFVGHPAPRQQREVVGGELHMYKLDQVERRRLAHRDQLLLRDAVSDCLHMQQLLQQVVDGRRVGPAEGRRRLCGGSPRVREHSAITGGSPVTPPSTMYEPHQSMFMGPPARYEQGAASAGLRTYDPDQCIVTGHPARRHEQEYFTGSLHPYTPKQGIVEGHHRAWRQHDHEVVSDDGSYARNLHQHIVEGRVAESPEQEALRGDWHFNEPHQRISMGRPTRVHEHEAVSGGWRMYSANQGIFMEHVAWRLDPEDFSGSLHRYSPNQSIAEERDSRLRDQDVVTDSLQALTAAPQEYDDGTDDGCLFSGGCSLAYGACDVDAQGGIKRKCDAWRPLGRSGVPSVGSAQHFNGLCRPCAHSWKPTGCDRGEDCERCHLCTEADFRLYRERLTRDRRARQRAAKRPIPL